jgi:flagellum-specific peptidoglycan hydrolase FlgJ
MTREEFFERAIAAAQTSSKTSGLPAGITVAQAALESALGNSELSRHANNYFGIKAHGKHAAVEMTTTEFERSVRKSAGNWTAGDSPAQPRRVSARFAAYESMADCFACRDRLILNGAVYKEARESNSNPEAFARALAKHWATDPKYAEKLLRIYRQNNLDRLDDHAGVGDAGRSERACLRDREHRDPKHSSEEVVQPAGGSDL